MTTRRRTPSILTGGNGSGASENSRTPTERVGAHKRFAHRHPANRAIRLATQDWRDGDREPSSILLAVLQRLVIDGGPIVNLEGRPAQGTRHEIMFGVLTDAGEPVVVKIERIPGAMDRERTALGWLGTQRLGVAPLLVAFGHATLDGERVSCLVTERCSGSPPATVDGWERMGGALARLTEVGPPDDLLPRLAPAEFVKEHADRVRELGARLDRFVEPIPDWAALRQRTLPAATMMVIAHADPGPGNYLDTGITGRLVDWEQAQIAPIGLDLGRLMFIALLGAGPAGYQAQDHQDRCRAAAHGYLSAVANHWRPTADDIRWWLSVAAIQFSHSRWRDGGRPAPWQQAAQILPVALNSAHNLHT
jgi:Phosphotransferase enzyme family